MGEDWESIERPEACGKARAESCNEYSPAAQKYLTDLGRHLHSLAGTTYEPPSEGLEATITFCDAALGPLRQALDQSMDASSQIQKDVTEFAIDFHAFAGLQLPEVDRLDSVE